MVAELKMHGAEVYELLKVHEAQGAEAVLRKSWLAAQKKPCKDVVVLALPVKSVPCTLDGFKAALTDGKDYVKTSWYVVYVGTADGKEWGWSNAPYDCKKKVPYADLKSLYSVDASGDHAGQTRFWSFKKVSNNMNKGARIDAEDGQDLSFVLPAGTCFSVFLREDSFDASKPLFAQGEGGPDVLEAYRPVLLQLSSTNGDQAEKGNGIKLRRVVPLEHGVLGSFYEQFFQTKQELDGQQLLASQMQPIRSAVKAQPGCPIVCRVSPNAFAFHDDSCNGLVEICDSGVDPELGCKVVVSVEMLLHAMHSSDLGRALRMFSVALSHGAVRCLVVQDSDACSVVHLQVDLAHAMWLHTLQKSKDVERPTELPASSMLTMCFGRAISASSSAADFGTDGPMTHLQWYNPSTSVVVTTADGRETRSHVVYEMDTVQRQMAGQRDVAQKLFFMDEVAGSHYVVKVYHTETVAFDPEHGLQCQNARLLVSWQLRPGFALEANAAGRDAGRKRQYMCGDATDRINCGADEGETAAETPPGPPEKAKKRVRIQAPGDALPDMIMG